MRRWFVFLFGIIGYAIGLGSLAVFIIFVSGWGMLPWAIDARTSVPLSQAVLTNLALITLFGLQHSVMARPGFKRLWTRLIPKPIERSCYCIATGIAVFFLCSNWQPMAGVIWSLDSEVARIVLTLLQAGGWVLVVASSFMINHFELFGTQQTYDHFVDRPVSQQTFTVRFMYQYVRHPLQLGMLIGIWATPHMSASHMFLSAAMTGYITIGLYLEERDLISELGEDYKNYRRQVPMIIPKFHTETLSLTSAHPSLRESSLAVTPVPQTREKP